MACGPVKLVYEEPGLFTARGEETWRDTGKSHAGMVDITEDGQGCWGDLFNGMLQHVEVGKKRRIEITVRFV